MFRFLNFLLTVDWAEVNMILKIKCVTGYIYISQSSINSLVLAGIELDFLFVCVTGYIFRD